MITVHIFSFGYHRKGIPSDESGHGGGFVFDCRALPNPGREDKWMHTNGLDPELAAYLESIPAALTFLEHSFALVDQTVDEYRWRGFDRLYVAFGCTGGQHRSVWCAERLAAHIAGLGCAVCVTHQERDSWQ